MNLFRSILSVGLAFAWLACSALAAEASTAALYKSKCQSCHGADGKASTIGKKLGARDFQDPAVTSMSEDDLATITSTGKNKMPAYKGKLKDDQIKALAKYIKEMK
jgi:mono/diheme cytochrome c family protein